MPNCTSCQNSLHCLKNHKKLLGKNFKGVDMFKFGLSIVLATAFMTIGCTKKKNYDEKVLLRNVKAKIKGLDPVNAGDTYSSREISRIYEGLLEYHYLKRPYTLQPNLAESMPVVSDDGLTYTFKIKKGILFQDNKCFPEGKGRELKASDFVYSIKRMADTRNISTGWWLLDDKVEGLNAWRDKYSGKAANYSDEIAGIKALDDYTLQFKLTTKYPQFLYSLAMVYTFAVPYEAVAMYGEEFLNNPVGTGAFMTETYKQSNKIVYVKNPNYRDVFYPSEGAPGDKERGLLKDAGKKLPLVDKIVVNIVPESSPRFLSFENGDVDFSEIPKDNFESSVTPSKEVTEAFKAKGIELEIVPDLDITYIAFNHDDPLFKNNLKLRQAMSLAYDVGRSNELFQNDRAVEAQTIIPPGIGGYDKDFVNEFAKYDLKKAKALLAEAGYPGGKGLPTIVYDTLATTLYRQSSEFFKKCMNDIGVNIEVRQNTWPQLVDKTKKRKAQMFGMAWLGDYPDAENFLQLLYGPNAAPGPNGSNYNNAEFNKEFEAAKVMQPGPERAARYAALAQKVAMDVPLIINLHRTTYILKHSWLRNHKFSSFEHGNSQYYAVDMDAKEKTIKSGVLRMNHKKATAKVD